MTERRTGRFVRLELVWDGRYLSARQMPTLGEVAVWNMESAEWECWAGADRDEWLGIHPTRAEAEDAVERAVVERMGGVDG